MLPSHIRELLSELETWGRENDRTQNERARKMLNLEPETAQLISGMLEENGAKKVLEIGTSNGYSTIWLADSVGSDGRVISIDRNPEKLKWARENLRRAGLHDRVELLLGDATAIVAQLDGPFDAAFFDADRFSAPAQLALLLPKLAPKALLLADNVLSHPEEIAGYLAAIENLIRTQSNFTHKVVPVGKGLSVARRLP